MYETVTPIPKLYKWDNPYYRLNYKIFLIGMEDDHQYSHPFHWPIEYARAAAFCNRKYQPNL